LNGKTKEEFAAKGSSNVFVIRPELQTLKIIKELTSSWENNVALRFIFVPRRTNECDVFIRDNLSRDVNEFKNVKGKCAKAEERIT